MGPDFESQRLYESASCKYKNVLEAEKNLLQPFVTSLFIFFDRYYLLGGHKNHLDTTLDSRNPRFVQTAETRVSGPDPDPAPDPH